MSLDELQVKVYMASSLGCFWTQVAPVRSVQVCQLVCSIMAVNNPPNSELKYSPQFRVTEEMKHAFDVNGYVIVRGLFDAQEVGVLRSALEDPAGVMSRRYIGVEQDEGATLKISVWNQPGNDVTGMVARSEKLVDTFEQLLRGELYHYHSKVIEKQAQTGGAFYWHQDYGYWHENGNIFPNMGTAWIAVDRADKENGCLQFLQGSQRAGRLTHVRKGDQAIADPERMKHMEKFFPRVHVEMDPGDCVLFHCNLLHSSAANKNNRRRWGFAVAYNRADNNPVYEHHHPQYTPLKKVANSAVAECKVVTDLSGKDFFLVLNDSESHMAFKNMREIPNEG